jgi:hypothetical protein
VLHADTQYDNSYFRQAIIAVKVFDKYTHDRTPFLVVNSKLEPFLFQEYVAAWEYGFVDRIGGFGPALIT